MRSFAAGTKASLVLKRCGALFPLVLGASGIPHFFGAISSLEHYAKQSTDSRFCPLAAPFLSLKLGAFVSQCALATPPASLPELAKVSCRRPFRLRHPRHAPIAHRSFKSQGALPERLPQGLRKDLVPPGTNRYLFLQNALFGLGRASEGHIVGFRSANRHLLAGERRSSTFLSPLTLTQVGMPLFSYQF